MCRDDRARRPTRSAAALAGALIALASTSVAAASAAAVDPEPMHAGELLLVSPANRDAVVAEGASATPFALRLPDGASCPGDSMHDDWRVSSFFTPVAVDPTTLQFTVNDPEGEGNWAMYDVDTSPYVDQLLLANEVAGEPGLVGDTPPLSFGVFHPGLLADGEYRIGIACTYIPRRMDRYWDTVIVVTNDATDEPGGFRWRLADSSVGAQLAAAPDDGPPRALVVALVAGAAGALAFAFMFVRHRRAPRLATSKESS